MADDGDRAGSSGPGVDRHGNETLFDVLPCATIDDVPDHRVRHPEGASQRCLADTACGVTTSDLNHLGSGQPRVVVSLAPHSTLTLCHVAGVFQARPKKPMKGVLARRVVAGMANLKARRDGADVILVSPPMRPAVLEPPVSVLVGKSGPRVAAIGRSQPVHLRLVAFDGRQPKRTALVDRRIRWVMGGAPGLPMLWAQATASRRAVAVGHGANSHTTEHYVKRRWTR